MKKTISVTVKPNKTAFESTKNIAKEIISLLNKKQIQIDVDIREFGFLNQRLTNAKYDFGNGVIRAGCSEGTRLEQIRKVISSIFVIAACKNENRQLSDVCQNCVQEFLSINPINQI